MGPHPSAAMSSSCPSFPLHSASAAFAPGCSWSEMSCKGLVGFRGETWSWGPRQWIHLECGRKLETCWSKLSEDMPWETYTVSGSFGDLLLLVLREVRTLLRCTLFSQNNGARPMEPDRQTVKQTFPPYTVPLRYLSHQKYLTLSCELRPARST